MYISSRITTGLSIILSLAVFSPMGFAEETKSSILLVQDAWVMEAPPVAKVHAAYMRLTNTSAATITITDVTAEHYSMAMIHQSKEQGGMATMAQLDTLVIAPHSTIVLEPGGMHIMLMQPDHPQKLNDKVVIVFQLKDGSQQVVEAGVRAAP